MPAQNKTWGKSLTGISLEQNYPKIISTIDNDDIDGLKKYISTMKTAIVRLRTEEKLNLLEYAIFYSDNIQIIWELLHNTPLKIRQIYIRHIQFDDSCNALLAAIKFQNAHLLHQLEAQSTEEVPRLTHAKTVQGDSALCLAIKHTAGQGVYNEDSVLQYLIHAKQVPLDKICRDDMTPFMLAAKHGKFFLTQRISDKLCFDNITSRQALTCATNRDGQTALHLATASASLETLEYVWENGGDTCVSLRDNNHRTAPDIAALVHNKEMTAFYQQRNSALGFLNIPFFSMAFFADNFLSILLSAVAIGITTILMFRFLRRHIKAWHEDYLWILESLVCRRQLGPTQFLGTLTEDDILHPSKKDFMNYKQIVSNVQCSYGPFSTTDEPYTIPIPQGEMPNRLFYPKDSHDPLDKIVIYIPGTASSVENPKIEATIASHLSYALNARVLLVHHSLAPHAKWPAPLNDVCRSIRYYYKQNKPKHIILAGYSVGGLLATLATLVMQELKIKVDRLILFSPALDMSGEFRDLNIDSEEDYEACQRYLPKRLQNEKDKIYSLQEQSILDKTFNNDSKPFPQMIALCFGEAFATPLQKLRRYSPAWFNSDCFQPDRFPKTTIIMGENDYFRVDAEVFFGKLKDAGCKATKIIIPKWDHTMMWQTIYPVYLAQSIRRTYRPTAETSFDEMQELDEKLNCQKSGRLSEEEARQHIRKLKKLCKNLNAVSLFRPKSLPKHRDSSTSPKYSYTF